MEVIFADALFDCASLAGIPTGTGKRRRHHWGWIADNVRPKKPIDRDAIRLFRDRLLNAIGAIEILPPIANVRADVHRNDARHLSLPDASADLVATSPPYLGMIDYARANRLTYLWMNWPLRSDMASEIGARYRRDHKDAVSEYLAAVELAASEIARVLKPFRHCALVIGESRKYPDMAKRVVMVFARFLKVVWGPTTRVPTRRRVGDRSGRDSLELVCVLRRTW